MKQIIWAIVGIFAFVSMASAAATVTKTSELVYVWTFDDADAVRGMSVKRMQAEANDWLKKIRRARRSKVSRRMKRYCANSDRTKEERQAVDAVIPGKPCTDLTPRKGDEDDD